jgi:hypothetical protein
MNLFVYVVLTLLPPTHHWSHIYQNTKPPLTLHLTIVNMVSIYKFVDAMVISYFGVFDQIVDAMVLLNTLILGQIMVHLTYWCFF